MTERTGMLGPIAVGIFCGLLIIITGCGSTESAVSDPELMRTIAERDQNFDPEVFVNEGTHMSDLGVTSEELQTGKIEDSERPRMVGGWNALYKRIKYPDYAEEKGISGTVLITTYIDEEGNVAGVRVRSAPDHSLGIAVKRAMYQCRFKPATYKGKSHRVKMTMPVRFQL